ncbi:collagen-like protein [Aggregatimonas sangjinii]|uniref:Collagen-like protein n=1 Tax=Aggregatimonas sangjinii TaxID=2583587 RepID=A0A5B7SR18_9FLAO|nr:collagen-like protein [Aggregatimonas sangjinii]QCW99369.1 collagen-like protein [Aggregatimonas sangjinii]
MKKSIFYLSMLLSLLVISCSGRDGLDGFDGRDGVDGVDGVNILGQVVDIQGTFDADGDYSIFYEFPQSIEVFETDVVLVYLLWDQTEDTNGDPVDIWRLMPQTRILDQGLLQYNYEHTFFDVTMFLEADFDIGTLPAADTDDQIFRIAIIPAEQAQGSRFDRSNVDAVMQLLGVKEKDVQRVKVN